MTQTVETSKPKTATKAKQSPFFCYKKNVRKTAYRTPEYMSTEDWLLLEKVLNSSGHFDLLELVFCNESASEAFFYRIIGWPEGRHYMRDADYARYALEGLKRHEWPKLEQALKLYQAGK